MKNFKIALSLMFIFSLLISVSWAQERPDVVSPFESLPNPGMNTMIMGQLIHLNKTLDAGPALQAGGDRLSALQNNDGGWDWPLDDGNPASTSPVNTLGPIAMGLAQAYFNTNDPDHLEALEDAGALLLTKMYNFSPCDGYLAAALDDIFGGTTYTDHVKTNFYDKLNAGTYNRNNAGTLYNTEAYINLIRTNRSGTQANMAAWDIGMGLVGAVAVGAVTTDWIAGTEAEINELDAGTYDVPVYYDVIGLAGAVFGLAAAGADYDPTAGEHAAASSTSDLADILASYQINASGGFAWNANWVIDNDGDEAIQETAYAILALNEFDRGTYLTKITNATNYLISVQLGTGGWRNYNYEGTSSTENNEVTGEALWAIAAGQNWLIPVELTSFSAQVVDNQVTLSWSTATETENLGFHIFRSMSESGDFSRITNELIKGAGSSDQAHRYSFTDKDVVVGNTYYYKLQDVDFNGNMAFHGPISVTVEASAPTKYELAQCYPNPFNPETAINFSIREAGKISLKIYNLQGQVIRTLVDGEKTAGSYSIMWNGTNDQGVRVSSGTYLYSLKVNGFEETKKLTVMK